MLSNEIQKGQNNMCVVAGNAPSLAEIDYNRLPLDYDVFRCNQFYFEDKYYLGKKVKFAFANPFVLFEQCYTYKTLLYKNEYEIENIVVSDFNLSCADSFYLKYLQVFDETLRGSRFISKLKDFYTFVRYNELYHNKRITSGIYMCAFAVALGYKEIYITGIDLYSAKEAYAFQAKKPDLLKILPNFNSIPDSCHTKEIDIKALEFLAKHYDIKFYSISPNSPINEHIQLANSKNNTTFIVKEKTRDSIKDMLIPSIEAYENLNHGIDSMLHYNHVEVQDKISQQEAIQAVWHEIDKYKKPLRNNAVYRLFSDIIKLPKDISKYIKGSKLRKKLKEKSIRGGGGTHSIIGYIMFIIENAISCIKYTYNFYNNISIREQ